MHEAGAEMTDTLLLPYYLISSGEIPFAYSVPRLGRELRILLSLCCRHDLWWHCQWNAVGRWIAPRFKFIEPGFVSFDFGPNLGKF